MDAGASTWLWNNVEIDNASGVTLSYSHSYPGATRYPGATINGTLTLTKGTFTNHSRYPTGDTVTIMLGDSAKIVRSGGSLSQAPIFGTSIDVEYTGSSGITTSYELPSSTTVLNNLTINNSAGITLDTDKTVNGTLTITSGTLADNGFTLIVKGNISNSGTHSGSGIISLSNGSASHTLSGAGAYGNFELNDTNGASLAGNPTVNDTLKLTNGSLSLGGKTLTINGQISTVSGSLTGDSTSNIIVGGSGANVTVPAVDLNNFTLNRSNGITLNGNVNVNGVLTLTNGNITTGSNKIATTSAGSVSRTNGHIVGNLQKFIGTGSTSLTFEIGEATHYSPVDVSFGNVSSAGILTATTTSGDNPDVINSGLSSSKTANRFWTLTNTGTVFDTYSSTFHFVPGDVDGGADTSNFIVQKKDGSSWSSTTTGIKTATSTQATGMTTFSEFAVGEPNSAPTATAVSISGMPSVGQTLIGTYTYSDIDGDLQGTSTFRWLRNNVEIIGSTSNTYSLVSADVNATIKFEVTPIALTGILSGSPVQSSGVGPIVGTPMKVFVETSADGSGSVVGAQTVASGSTVTGYAIMRDSSNNFVANVRATWLLINKSGGVSDTDLIAAPDGKSATFTGHVVGTARMQADTGSLTPTPSGILTVSASTATKVIVETAANGSGNVVGAQTVASGSAVTGYVITRDASDNFVANVRATWLLINKTGGVSDTDLVVALDGKSAVFTGHVIGTARMQADTGSLTPTPSGILTVSARYSNEGNSRDISQRKRKCCRSPDGSKWIGSNGICDYA